MSSDRPAYTGPHLRIEDGVEVGDYEGVEYEDFWAGSAKANLNELEHLIAAELLPERGRRIVEIGCGYGRLADAYLGRFDEIVLSDPSLSLLRHAQERHGEQATYVAADVNRLPFRDGSFDAALMVRVFHHLRDSRTPLMELDRTLESGGTLVFNYSNKRNVLRVGKWLARRGDSPFGPGPVAYQPALYGHHPASVAALLDELGFTAVRYRGAGVVDKVVGPLGSAGRGLPPGLALSRPLGTVKLAPIVFVSARASGSAPAPGGDFLVCPVCRGALATRDGGLECESCGRAYGVDDGIIDLRPV